MTNHFFLAQSIVDEMQFGDTHIRSLAIGSEVYTSFRETISIQVRTHSSVAKSSEPQRDSETELNIQLLVGVNYGQRTMHVCS